MIYRLLILLALALVGVAVWLTLAPRQPEPVLAHSSGPAGPDQGYSATDAEVIETGPDGLPMYTLQARQVQQDADPNLINLATVVATFRDTRGGQWQAHADRAVARQDSAQIDLAGHIDVAGSFAHGTQPIRFLSDTLHVDTRADLLRTRDEITLDWSGRKLNARGMVANLKDDHIKLESQVHGQFTP